ncbi:ATP-binding protein [Marinobacter sp. ELB17]|uniref:ATP-binding protein n=1 Tax=Marinobacter sp. ELB17 TaxID=270374 RepID=UPI0000F381D9|nr:ATP-binding protein [Marinobacter sp. ELB17]EAZ98129.1 hypothetical protein MELB17_09603 [Marinobacter sp. ELB17]
MSNLMGSIGHSEGSDDARIAATDDVKIPSYGLESIILHHSFKNVRGRTIQVDCRQRTHLGGINGAGKTSILALIPAFYGEEPERIVAKSSGRQSFLDYYLPSLQSLIIFEYQKHGGPCCSVMYRHDTGKLCYRFVEGSATETFFHPDVMGLLEAGADNREIFARLRELGIKPSKKLDTITDYRAVIQRNARLLRRRPAETRHLRDLAGNFGLGGPDTKMAHIDRLTHVVLNKNRLLSSFKTMICETQFDDVHLNRRPKPVDRQTLVDDIRSVRDFASEENSIRVCISKESERQATLESAKQTAANVRASIACEQDTLQAHRKAVDLSEERLGDLADLFNDDQRALIRDHTTVAQKHELQKSQLDALYVQRQTYDDKEAAELDQELTNLPEREKSLSTAEADFAQMTSRVVQVEDQYAQDVQNLNHAFADEQGRRKNKVRDAGDSLKELARQHQSTLHKIELEGEKEHAKIERERSAKRSVLSDQLTRAITLRDNVGETPEETLRFELAEAAVAEAERVAIKADEAKLAAIMLKDQALEDQNSALAVLQQTERRLVALRDDEVSLKRLLHPEDGTWISTLRKEGVGWADTLAKVVDPDLLYRQGLNPQRIAGDGADQGVMGWSLLLDNVPVPTFAASDEELIRQLEDAALAIDKGLGAVRQAEDAAEAGNKAYIAKRKNVEKLETELGLARATVDRQRGHHRDARTDIRQAKDQRQAAHVKAVIAIEDQARQFDSESRDLLDRSLNGASSQKMDQIGLWADIEAQARLSIEAAEDLVAQADKEHTERLKRRLVAYNQKLEADGVDPAIIQGQRTRVEQAQKTVDRIRATEDLVVEYRRWLKSEWGEAQTLTENVSRLSAQVQDLSTRLKDLERDFKIAEAAEKQIRQTSDGKAKRLHIQIEDANTTLRKSLELAPDEGALGVPGDLVALTKDLQEEGVALLALRKEVLIAFKRTQTVLNRYSGTLIHAAWKKFTEYRRNQLSDIGSEFDEAFQLDQIADLSFLLDNDIPHIKATVGHLFASEAGTLQDYFDSLESMAREVRRVSSLLRQQMNLNQKIESITDIEVILRARIEDDDSWRPLKAFIRAWGDWHALNPGEIPSESIIIAFKEVCDTLSSANLGDSIESMIDMTLSMKENGNPVRIRNDNDFRQVSSEGLSYLAIMAVFMGMTRYLCPDLQTRITWPVDEIGKLDPQNIARLAAMLEENNLTMISACPELSRPLRKFFETKSFIRGGQIFKFESVTSEGSDDALIESLATPRKELTAEVANNVG